MPSAPPVSQQAQPAVSPKATSPPHRDQPRAPHELSERHPPGHHERQQLPSGRAPQSESFQAGGSSSSAGPRGVGPSVCRFSSWYGQPMHIPTPKAASPRRQLRVLHLFSGSDSRPDGLAALLKTVGWLCDDFDLTNGEHQNVADDLVWLRIITNIRIGYYDFVWCGTPCETFSHVREVRPGPPPLRSIEHPYGLPKLAQHLKEQVRLANLLVLRTVEACREAFKVGAGWAIENPRPWPNSPSLFDIKEVVDLQRECKADAVDFDQCMFGAEATKPTRVLYHGLKGVLLKEVCNHPQQWWKTVGGQDYKSRHERLQQRKRDDGQWATKALGAYPKELNQRIAALITLRGSAVPVEANTPSPMDWFQ